jgi:glycosyltransferase involved in cell wall biosynthesis
MRSKVTIIMPFYNAEKTIEQSINSVLEQNHIDFELILIDDGSTDSTLEQIKSFSDARIITLRQDNQGVASARNLGLDQSSGDYICFLDADDLMPVDSITSRLEVFSKNSKIEIVGGSQLQKNEHLTEDLLLQVPDFEGIVSNQLVRLNPKVFINCGTWLIKKSVIGSLRFPLDWTHSEDLAFFYKISKGIYLSSTEGLAQLYRRHSRSAMSNLKGLAEGYLNFICLVKKENESFADVMYLKFKSAKIMFLSFFRNSEYLNSIKFSFKIIFH